MNVQSLPKQPSSRQQYLLYDQPPIEPQFGPLLNQLKSPFVEDNYDEIPGRLEDFDQISITPPKHEVGIYGWRKKIIYLLLAVIILLVGVNFALTFWIVSFLGLTSNGISGLDISSDTATFKGIAVFNKILFAKEISSIEFGSLKFTSNNGNIVFGSKWPLENGTETKLKLSKRKIQLQAEKFEIYNGRKELMFALEDLRDGHSQVTLNTDTLQITNPNGLRLPISLQTGLVDSSVNDNLQILSPQGRIRIMGPQSVAIESKVGDVSVVTYQTLLLKANGGKIIFESNQAIYFRKLTTIQFEANNTNLVKPDVYQVCICGKSGRLFLAESDSICAIRSATDCR